MKNTLTMGIIVFLLINSFGAVAMDYSNSLNEIKERICVSQITIKDMNEYVSLHFKESDSFICKPGKPLLPVISKVFTFPLGTKIVDVIVHCEWEEFILPKKIQPASSPTTILGEFSQELNERDPDECIYCSSKFFPLESYTTSGGAGLHDNDHVLFLNVKVAPRYSPLLDLLFIPKVIEITVEYQVPEKSLFTADEYDLVIIAPDQFSSSLQLLIDHKNRYGVRTFLKTTEEIYNEYEGRDNAEQIKYFIKDAIETYGISYVFLVGNIDLVPIRMANLHIETFFTDVPTDHYYADIYDSNGSFCSWDTNSNNIFGEGTISLTEDIIEYIDYVDLYPDIGIGRAPCYDIGEVKSYINKIVSYETTTHGKDWFKRIILMGGDTAPDNRSFYEGEWTTEQVAQEMQNHGFKPVKLWASLDTFYPRMINREINTGAGFLSYSGHGAANFIGTCPPNVPLTILLYFKPYLIGLHNQNKLPIIFMDGCLTGCIDKTFPLLNISFNIRTSGLAWSFVKKEMGGAITAISATRVAFISVNEDEVVAGSPILNINFFKSYKPGMTVSQMLTNAQTTYLNYMQDYWRDGLTIEEYILLGDPSLKVGGYE
jgi:hypothetical protein